MVQKKKILHCFKRRHCEKPLSRTNSLFTFSAVVVLPSDCILSSLFPAETDVLVPRVRFSKDPKTSRGRKLFGALFGLFSRVPESVSQSPRKQLGFQANVLGFAHGRHWAVIRGKERGLIKRLETYSRMFRS